LKRPALKLKLPLYNFEYFLIKMKNCTNFLHILYVVLQRIINLIKELFKKDFKILHIINIHLKLQHIIQECTHTIYDFLHNNINKF
jgi:hypothetical protein